MKMEESIKRYADAEGAHHDRNVLIGDPLPATGESQNTKERRAFVLVLIDGDNMNVSTASSGRLEMASKHFI